MSVRRRSAISLLAVAALAAPVLAFAPAASAEEPQTTDDSVTIVTEPTAVTILGLDDHEVGDSVPLEELIAESESVDQPITDQLGAALEEVPSADVAPASQLRSGAGIQILPASTKSSGIAHSSNSDYWIKTTWRDNKNLTVALRWGSSTWGWTKVSTKHQVTLNMLQKTTKFPRSRVLEGSSYVYITPANHYTCWLAACWVDKTMDVKVVSENTKLSDGLPKGIITGYCIGVTVCPQWVRDAAG